MLSGGFQHSVRQSALWKTDQCWNHMFQRSQILDELIPPAHTESSVTFSSKNLHQLEIQWWIFFIIFQTTCLEDFFLQMICFG
jgi:hypothetical protein